MNQRSNGKQLARHLESTENEKVSVILINGALSDNTFGVINEFEAISKGSKAKKPLAHCIMSPHPDEKMDADKWALAWKVFEKIHGLSGYAKIIIQHKKLGRIHQHAVYNRIDIETGKAINLSHTHRKNELVSRLLEIEFKHKITKGKHNKAVLNELKRRGMNKSVAQLAHLAKGSTPNALYSHKEHQMEKRGVPISQSRLHISEAWLTSNSPQSLSTELAKLGYLITNGIKTPIVISNSGREIPLLRTINAGLKAKGISRIKLSELNKKLPKKPIERNEVISNYKHHIERLKNNNKHPINSLFVSNGHEFNKWKKYRQDLLGQTYNKEFSEELSKYWKVSKLQDGSVVLQNNSGKIIDKGNCIEADMNNNKLAAKTMVGMAIARGWSEVIVTGSDSFKEAHFSQAKKHGLKVQISNKNDQKIWDSVNIKRKSKEKRTVKNRKSLSNNHKKHSNQLRH